MYNRVRRQLRISVCIVICSCVFSKPFSPSGLSFSSHLPLSEVSRYKTLASPEVLNWFKLHLEAILTSVIMNVCL